MNKGEVNLREKKHLGKFLVVGLIVLLVGASIVSGFALKKESSQSVGMTVYEQTGDLRGPPLNNPDDDWDYWTNSPNMFSNVTGNIGIGTNSPTSKLHIVGSTSVPLVNIEQTGSFRGLRVSTTNACAIWVENAGNHGLRITNAGGNGVLVSNANNDGIHVDFASNWAGYFNGKAFFGGNVGIGTETPTSELEVNGTIYSSDGGFKFPDGTTQTTAAIGNGEGNTLDLAYDEGGPGAGRTITADSGSVNIDGPDGLTVSGFVGVNNSNPEYELDVSGNASVESLYTKEIIFETANIEVWKMYMDLRNLYLENLLSGEKYQVLMFKVSASGEDFNLDSSTQINQEIINLKIENEMLNQRIEKLERALSQISDE